jgi:type II secretory pathway pseudopilin PulG
MRAGKGVPVRRQAGFTYVAVLFALAIFGLGLAALGESWSAASKRAREAELIEAGAAFVKAIGAYYMQSPGAVKAYPQRLEQLLEDQRFVGLVRHLRRVVRDPVTGNAEWGLVRAPDGGIRGVYSLSDKETLRRQPLQLPDALPVSGPRYADWKFVYEAPRQLQPQPQPQS